MKVYGVIMAGGGGTRFWPLSRKETPKQLLNLSGKDAMINETILRLSPIIEKDNLFVVTNSVQAKKMQSIVGDKLNKDNVLVESAARNTSACIGYSAINILKKYGDGVMIVSPSDAYIRNEEEYRKVLKLAVAGAEKNDCIVTIGVTPTFPATGYGYIRYIREDSILKKVGEFVEKPDENTAKQYLKSGDYVWNSGVFVFKASVILDRIKEFLPELYDGLIKIENAMLSPSESRVIDEVYPLLPSVSIDYGVMERAKDIYVIPAEFGWNDVGSWDMLEVLHELDEKKNISIGNNVLLDTKNSTVFSSGRTVAVIGVDDLIVVETPDAVLVCPKNRAQEVKKVVDLLKEKGKSELI